MLEIPFPHVLNVTPEHETTRNATEEIVLRTGPK